MSDNLVSAVSRYLTPELVSRMAATSGIDQGKAQSAVDAAIPALLSSLANLAADPGGARQLANAVADQPVGILGSLANSIGTFSPTAERGAGQLTALLGSTDLSALTSAVSRSVGIGEGSARTLFGLLTPAILGVLGRQQRAGGLEANGLARMLSGQKDQIASAMPAGLAGLLRSDSLKPVDIAQTRAYEAPRIVHSAPQDVSPAVQMVSRPTTDAPRVSWPLWLLPLLALAGLIWFLMPGNHLGQHATAPDADGLPRYLARPAGDWLPIGSYINQDVYNRAGEKLGTVKDLFVGRDGRIQAAVVGVGRFLGIGEKEVALPITSLQMEKRDNADRLVIDASKDALQAAPAFEASGKAQPKAPPPQAPKR
jgi:hypothetical protein